MIELDSIKYPSMEAATEAFATATSVTLYSLPLVTALPELPAATEVWLRDLPLVTALPELPAATSVTLDGKCVR